MTALTPAEAARQVATIEAVQAACPSRGDTEPAEAPEVDWRSDWDGDRAAEKWENETRRWWP